MLNTLKCVQQKSLWKCSKQDQGQWHEYKQVIEKILSKNSGVQDFDLADKPKPIKPNLLISSSLKFPYICLDQHHPHKVQAYNQEDAL